MKKQFVTYEIALKLKELGFNEKCLAYYEETLGNYPLIITHYEEDLYLKAPLWQQAIDWLFTEKKLSIDTDFTETESEYGFQYMISKLGDYDYNDEDCRHSCKIIYDFKIYYKTKIECYEAAILKSIELI